MEDVEELKKSNKVIGAREVWKALLSGKLHKIYLAKNCPEALRRKFEEVAGSFKVKLINFSGSNYELGVVCGRKHGISVLGILKNGEDQA